VKGEKNESISNRGSQFYWLTDCDVNIRGFINLLEASRLTGVKRIVFASSAAIYGDTAVLPIHENCKKLLFFSLSQTKLISYILPMYPPLALLTGYYFNKVWTEKRERALKCSAGVFVIVAAILIAGLVYAETAVTGKLIVSVKVLAVILTVLAASVLLQSFRHNFRAVFTTQVLGTMIFFTDLMTQVLPIITPGLSVKSFVHEFQQYYDGQAPVYVEKFYRPGFMYNSGIAGIELSQENLAAVIASEKDTAYLVMKKKKYRQLPPAIENKLRLLVVQEDKILLIHENK
jgi:4-amino-4-deoxy-L-arabinose transferase-like glycosyltransferase